MIEKQEKFCRMFQQIREKYQDADDEAFDVLQMAFEEAVSELKESRDSLQEFLLDLKKKNGSQKSSGDGPAKRKSLPLLEEAPVTGSGTRSCFLLTEADRE